MDRCEMSVFGFEVVGVVRQTASMDGGIMT